MPHDYPSRVYYNLTKWVFGWLLIRLVSTVQHSLVCTNIAHWQAVDSIPVQVRMFAIFSQVIGRDLKFIRLCCGRNPVSYSVEKSIRKTETLNQWYLLDSTNNVQQSFSFRRGDVLLPQAKENIALISWFALILNHGHQHRNLWKGKNQRSQFFFHTKFEIRNLKLEVMTQGHPTTSFVRYLFGGG